MHQMDHFFKPKSVPSEMYVLYQYKIQHKNWVITVKLFFCDMSKIAVNDV